MAVGARVAIVGLCLAFVASAGQYRERLIFADDFDTLDMRKWKHELTMGGGGNWEFEMYVNSRRNSYTRDGVLFLKPTLSGDVYGEKTILGQNANWQQNHIDMWGSTPADMCTGNQFWGCDRIATPVNPINYIQSARVRTAESFSFKYGRVEIRAALPRGDWLWPAIWMLPRDNVYGPWPTSGEIDIMESRGNPVTYKKPSGEHIGCDTYGATAHWGPIWNRDGFSETIGNTSSKPGEPTLAESFHVYGLYWDENGMTFYLDDESNVVNRVTFADFWKKGVENKLWADADAVGRDEPFKGSFTNPWISSSNRKAAPFDQEFFLIMNLAVGGTAGAGLNAYFPDGLGGKPWTNKDLDAQLNFINAKSQWMPSWSKNGTNGQIGESAALRVDSVRVWALEGISTWTYYGAFSSAVRGGGGAAGATAGVPQIPRATAPALGSALFTALVACAVFVCGVFLGFAFKPQIRACWRDMAGRVAGEPRRAMGAGSSDANPKGKSSYGALHY